MENKHNLFCTECQGEKRIKNMKHDKIDDKLTVILSCGHEISAMPEEQPFLHIQLTKVWEFLSYLYPSKNI
jgi:hypothetical protein